MGDEFVVYFWPFFYDSPISMRAAIVLHEARHADGCHHNYVEGTSDRAWNNGCSWKPFVDNDGLSYLPSQAGAYQYQATWLWALYVHGQANPAIRARALLEANMILNSANEVNGRNDNHFLSDPCFRIGADGHPFIVPGRLCSGRPELRVGYPGRLSTVGDPDSAVSYAGGGQVEFSTSEGVEGNWTLRKVDYAGYKFIDEGAYQIYKHDPVDGTEICLRPAGAAAMLPVLPFGGRGAAVHECQYYEDPAVEAMSCSNPTEQSPQSSTWWQVAGTENWDAVAQNMQMGVDLYIRPVSRCRNFGSQSFLRLLTCNYQCLTASEETVVLSPCAGLSSQQFRVSAWQEGWGE